MPIVHTTKMGDFWGADTTGSGIIEGDHRERDARYNQHIICCYPTCFEWIKNGAKTCKRHRSWYDTNIRFPARRLNSLLCRLEDLSGNLKIVDEGDAIILLDCAVEDGLRAAYDRLALILEDAL